MNIIIIHDFTYVNGGAGQVALSSALELAKKGHAVTIFAAVGKADTLVHDNLKIISLNQYEIVSDPKRLRAMLQGLWNKKAAKVFKQLLTNFKPGNTIIHVHSWTKALSSSPIRVAIKKKFKVVCTLHDYFTVCPNGGLYNYQQKKICKIKPMSFKCFATHCDSRNYPHKLWRFLRQFIQIKIGLIPNGIKHFVAVSNFSENILKPHLSLNATIHVISNPIDFVKNPPVKVEENKKLFFVGRLSPEKGVLLLAKASASLRYKVVLVGSGELNSQVSEINPTIEILGWKTRDEVLQLLRSARALIFPSLLYETQGLAVLEAAALGIPSIISNTSAATDFVENNISGIWFESADINDLINKVALLNSDEFTKTLGENAYNKYWEKPMVMESHVQHLENIYNNILSE